MELDSKPLSRLLFMIYLWQRFPTITSDAKHRTNVATLS